MKSKRQNKVKKLPLSKRIKGVVFTWPFLIVASLTIAGFALRYWNVAGVQEIMFDEKYYISAANQYLRGTKEFPLLHPPLGLLIIALSIKIFGNVWFAYRIVQVAVGTLIIPLGYLLTKEIIGKRAAIFSVFLFFLEGSLIVYSRAALTDIFLVFLIMLSLFLFYKFLNTKNTIYLPFCGLAIGLAGSIKFAGFFVAILCFLAMWLYRVNYKKIASLTLTYLILVPVLVYLIPFFIVGKGFNSETLRTIYAWHKASIQYDTTYSTRDNQLISSNWWTWFFLWKPNWFYFREFTDKVRGVLMVGNPFIWWATFLVIPLAIKKSLDKDKTNLLILAGFIIFIFPFLFSTKLTYIYYAIPSLLFVILGISYWLDQIYDLTIKKVRIGKILFSFYMVLTIALFAFFIPLWIGIPLNRSYFYFHVLSKNWSPVFGVTGHNGVYYLWTY